MSAETERWGAAGKHTGIGLVVRDELLQTGTDKDDREGKAWRWRLGVAIRDFLRLRTVSYPYRTVFFSFGAERTNAGKSAEAGWSGERYYKRA